MRGLRKKLLRVRVLAPLAMLIAVMLWVWKPWQPRIVIRERTNARDGAVMVWVPAGTFRMGKSVGGYLRDAARQRDWDECRLILFNRQDIYLSEAPARTVYLDGYWIYKYEVTVKQYRQFCLTTGRQMPQEPDWGWHEDHPIVNVSWDDASAYAAWAGASLPTEAQWEKAGRGPGGLVYPWGNAWDGTKCLNSVDADLEQPSPVGSVLAGASLYGAQDLAGNAWEWCADWYDQEYYKEAPRQNPTGPATGIHRVFRGGSWLQPAPDQFRCAYREGIFPDFVDSDLGFRCVLASPGL